MTGGIINFPNPDRIDADSFLEECKGKYEAVIVIGVTADDKADNMLCGVDAERAIYLLRTLEHLIIARELE